MKSFAQKIHRVTNLHAIYEDMLKKMNIKKNRAPKAPFPPHQSTHKQS